MPKIEGVAARRCRKRGRERKRPMQAQRKGLEARSRASNSTAVVEAYESREVCHKTETRTVVSLPCAARRRRPFFLSPQSQSPELSLTTCSAVLVRVLSSQTKAQVLEAVGSISGAWNTKPVRRRDLAQVLGWWPISHTCKVYPKVSIQFSIDSSMQYRPVGRCEPIRNGRTAVYCCIPHPAVPQLAERKHCE